MHLEFETYIIISKDFYFYKLNNYNYYFGFNLQGLREMLAIACKFGSNGNIDIEKIMENNEDEKEKSWKVSINKNIVNLFKNCLFIYLFFIQYTYFYILEVVYSRGNLNECCPWAGIFGRSPAFGIMFHERTNVTLSLPL